MILMEMESTKISNNKLINIVDYSPEWDFVEGGAKIIICYQPPINFDNTI